MRTHTIILQKSIGNIKEPNVIYSKIHAILSSAKEDLNDNQFGVGVFTTENRNKWAEIRKHLLSLSQNNIKSFNIIDSAIFCLCLDDIEYDENQPANLVQYFLYEEAQNRWYDKSLSIIIGKDGTAGINFEHSWGDGVAVLRFFHEIYNDTTKGDCFLKPNSTHLVSDDEPVVPVNFEFDDYTLNALNDAKRNHNNVINNLEMNVYQEKSVNREFCKIHKISPDSLMQLGFQLAYYKQNGTFVGTYESCSTAAFRHGRTETMRPCTEATTTFCLNHEKPFEKRPAKGELKAMIHECSKQHSELTKNCAMGQGFDRHLFGLRITAERNNIDIPQLYKDEIYARLNKSILSTSTLSSHALLAGGFGPVVKEGYGIGYNIQENMSGTLITNYKSSTNGSDFIDSLRESYKQIRYVIQD